MVGIECKLDSDCLYGANCDVLNGLCNHTLDHLLECYLEQIDPVVGHALFNHWRIPKEISPELLRDEILGRHAKDFCNGPGAFAYR